MEHDLSENRFPLFRIMLMDGHLARPRFSFAWAGRGSPRRRRRSQRRALRRRCLLIQISRHALPRRALRRGDIARRRFENVLPSPRLLRVRHAIERAAQAAGRFAAAAALPAARIVRTSPPQGERVAIAALLQCLLDGDAPRIFDRIKLWFGLHARLEHGGQHGEVLVFLALGIFHGQTLPSRGALLRPRFVVRTIGNGSRAGEIRSHQLRNRFGPRKGQGWGLPFGLPLRQFRPVARIARSEIRERRFGSIAAPGFRFAQPGLRRKLKEAERRQTQVTNRRTLRCGACSTECTRLRLSQSREAPPAPVVMPGD
jgi:hypothetical protein